MITDSWAGFVALYIIGIAPAIAACIQWRRIEKGDIYVIENHGS